jgi:uracil-DNA glycosylase family 4
VTGPGRDCPLCPRLAAFREANRAKFPGYFNAPVPGWGPEDAPLWIIGLAPGLHGANRTGRPFTGDYAGDLLYATLKEFGLARGKYAESADDGLELTGCRIVNAVRCVPPQNKPTGPEIKTCRPFLAGEVRAARPKILLALGRIAHDQVLKVTGERAAARKFGHGARHDLGGITLVDSYHCSRYNTNTGRLTPEMFRAVFADIAGLLGR